MNKIPKIPLNKTEVQMINNKNLMNLILKNMDLSQIV